MAKKITTTNTLLVDNVKVRMYRIGTGDCFLLQFRNNESIKFNLMIDCGCILGGTKDFEEQINDLAKQTKGSIDLLVVTHEHADHINGFKLVSKLFDEKLSFKKVWFAWTEAKTNFANNFRKEHAKMKMAINNAVNKLLEAQKNDEFKKQFNNDAQRDKIIAANDFFIDSLAQLNAMNEASYNSQLDEIKTMEDILREFKIIKKDTKVEFLEPGQTIENILGLEGIRFFVLGPPQNNDDIKQEEIKGEGYEKRKSKSTVDLSFQNLMLLDESQFSKNDMLPFDENYILTNEHAIQKTYQKKGEEWRKIDNDWLFSAGSLALRHETSINNTSLAIAIQFTESEKILLFPGDAEQGSWLSWHKNMNWTYRTSDNKVKKLNAEHILNNTVFYKVSHHMSQNGTPKAKGLEMFKNDEFAAMVTLDFDKIQTIWLNTMPNDLIGAELIQKTKGKLFFVGDRNQILKNIKTDRTSINENYIANLETLNKPFDGKIYIDYVVRVKGN